MPVSLTPTSNSKKDCQAEGSLSARTAGSRSGSVERGCSVRAARARMLSLRSRRAAPSRAPCEDGGAGCDAGTKRLRRRCTFLLHGGSPGWMIFATPSLLDLTVRSSSPDLWPHGVWTDAQHGRTTAKHHKGHAFKGASRRENRFQRQQMVLFARNPNFSVRQARRSPYDEPPHEGPPS